MITLFFSYSHRDEALRNELQKHLTLLKRQGVIDIWYDRQIDAGLDVHNEISENLEKADIILLLVSADYLASNYCYDIELKRALERHQRGETRVIPVILRPCEWQTSLFGRLKATPNDGKPVTKFENPDDAFLEITHAIRKAARKLDTPLKPPVPDSRAKTGWHAHIRFLAVLSLLILAGVGFWYWDAYYRKQSEYYANVTTRWGLPEGVGSLNSEQVKQRSISLKFIKRGRRKGVVEEIRAVNNRDAYPPEFTYFPSMSLIALNPLSDGTAEFLNLLRVTFERDPNGWISYQRGYDRDNRLLYTLHYVKPDSDLIPDTAEYRQPKGIKEVRESHIAQIKFIRHDTGPLAGLVKVFLFKDSGGLAQRDRDGNWGVLRHFDPEKPGFPLPVEEINLDQKGQPAQDNRGVKTIRYRFDEQGNPTRLIYLDANDRRIEGANGIAEQRFSYDQDGNLTQQAFYGTKEVQLVTSKDNGFAVHEFEYKDGHVVRNSFYDPSQHLVKSALGIAEQRISWNEDETNETISNETFYGPDGKPILVDGRFSAIKGVYDKRGRPVQLQYLDTLSNENNKAIPVLDAKGCAKISITYKTGDSAAKNSDWDEKGVCPSTPRNCFYSRTAVCYGLDNQPVRRIDGDAKIENCFDEQGNSIEERYFDPDGRPEKYDETYVKTSACYNDQGNMIETTYWDKDDKLVNNKDGFAKVANAYDSQGKLTEISLFDKNGQLTKRKGGYAMISREYDPLGNMIQEITKDVSGKPVRSEDGYAITKYEYSSDTGGNSRTLSYFDEHGNPTVSKDGEAREKDSYDQEGRLIDAVFFGLDHKRIMLKKYGFSKVTKGYDGATGNVSTIEYFDTNNHPVQHAYGYQKIEYDYDKHGREIKRNFFDINGKPVTTNVTVDKVEPNRKSQQARLQVGDLILKYDGSDVGNGHDFFQFELEKGESDRKLVIERNGEQLTIPVNAGRLTGLETVDKVPSRLAKSTP